MSALDTSLTPTPSGKLTASNSLATIDYSNTADTRYQYDLPIKQCVTFPLADGNGSCSVKVMEEVSNGNRSGAIMQYIGNGSNYKVRWVF